MTAEEKVSAALHWCLAVHQGMDDDEASDMADELTADVMPVLYDLIARAVLSAKAADR